MSGSVSPGQPSVARTLSASCLSPLTDPAEDLLSPTLSGSLSVQAGGWSVIKRAGGRLGKRLAGWNSSSVNAEYNLQTKALGPEGFVGDLWGGGQFL